MTRRPEWTTIFAWGLTLASTAAVLGALLSWSWRGLGIVAITTAALFALLMLAIWIYGRKS